MRIRLSRAFCTFIFTSLSLWPFSGHGAGIQMVTVDSTGNASGQATTGGSLIHKDASMSGDGRKVVFTSMADNLTSPLADNDDADGFSNNLLDIFLWDGTNTIVGMAGGSSGDGSGIKGHISRNGDHIAFINDSTNLDVDDPNPIPTPTPDGDDHVYLLSGGNVTFLTLNFDATSPAGGSPGAGEVQVDNSGRVFFTWAAFDLIDDEVICDRNGDPDLFVYDPASSNDNKIELITISQNPDFTGTSCDAGATDMTSNDGASTFRVAPGGQVVFLSPANDLVSPQVESDSDEDVFLWDNGTITMLSEGKGGENPVISADGTAVAFQSFADDMVAGMTDTNGGTDVFLWKQGVGLRLASVNELGTGTGDGGAFNPSISGDGTKVTFQSSASNISPTDHHNSEQIYLFDLLNILTPVSMVSVKANPANPDVPEGADGSSFDGRISEDGSTVAFRSLAHDLTGGTVTGSLTQIYIRDLDIGVNQLLTPGTTTGEGANGASFTIDISSDGRYVLFSSAATDLVSGIDDSSGSITPADDIFIAEQLGYVEFDEPEYEITETDSGTPQVTVTVNRLKAGDSAASVDFRTDDADPETTATAGVDYTTATGTLDWAAGETGPKTFTVDIIGETDPEADEFIVVILENPTGTGIGNQGSTKIKIVNDDENCSDDVNNDPDEDSDVDCDDSECVGTPACTEICDDTIDNDDDLLVDCDDTDDCSSAPNCLNPEICNNGNDDDSDTLIDCLDTTDCASDPACTDPSGDSDGDGVANDSDNCPGISNPGQEDTDNDDVGNACDTTENDCGNNQNDDGDGLSDCGDPDCSSSNECVDSDGDAIVNADDNCPNANNPGQEDTDNDGTGNACDASEGSCNNGVTDDTDSAIDCADSDCAADPVCVSPGNDDDGDGVLNASDNCPAVANPGQENTDGDGFGNACDAVEGNCTNGVTDDTDGAIDCADPDCALAPTCLDDDSDGVPNVADNCDNVSNPGQEDTDSDGTGNACDSTEGVCNNGVSDDTDGDIDCADTQCSADPVCASPGGDDDGDGILNGVDNCPSVSNSGQENTDGDGFGNACDTTEGDCDNGVTDDTDSDVDCDDSQCALAPNCADDDGDGVTNPLDNCPAISNAGQEDTDSDLTGNVCDSAEDDCTNGVTDDTDGDVDCADADCSADPACIATLDTDSDGVPDASDNCPAVPNTDQADTDNDGVGNVCDTVENLCNNGVSDDNDALADCEDADCSSDPLCAAQPDGDGDGIPDSADNCPGDANSDQTDSDGDGTGNVCDSTPGDDGDGDGDGNGGGPGAFPPGTTPRGGGGFCQLRPEASGGSVPWNYLLTVVGLGAWRLRRKR